MGIIKSEPRIDYNELAAEVNKRLGGNHSVGYVRSVHKGNMSSTPILNCINEILEELKV
jgi:hypothetical protein